MKYYKCGTILKTHGIKGDLKVKEETDFNRFDIGNTLYILLPYIFDIKDKKPSFLQKNIVLDLIHIVFTYYNVQR